MKKTSVGIPLGGFGFKEFIETKSNNSEGNCVTEGLIEKIRLI